MRPAGKERKRTDIHRIERLAIVSFGKLQGTFSLAKLDESYGPVRGRISVKSVVT
jgi:hypothetical protein